MTNTLQNIRLVNTVCIVVKQTIFKHFHMKIFNVQIMFLNNYLITSQVH